MVYLRPEGFGDGLRERLQRINRPQATMKNVNVPDLTSKTGVGSRAQPVEQREIGIGGQILRDLGLSKLRILTEQSALAIPRPARLRPGNHRRGLVQPTGADPSSLWERAGAGHAVDHVSVRYSTCHSMNPHTPSHMTPDEFRRHGHAVIDWIAEYMQRERHCPCSRG